MFSANIHIVSGASPAQITYPENGWRRLFRVRVIYAEAENISDKILQIIQTG